MLTLSSPARSVAAFALGFLLVSGELDRIGHALISIFSADGGQDQLIAATVVTVLVAGGVLWFAGTAVAAATESWTVALGQSARVLALVGLVIAVLTLTAAVVQDHQVGGYYFG